MAYSTGSGTYVDLMNAVLAHAVADGWSTTGGTWPISKGIIKGVAWTSTVSNIIDYTAGAAANREERVMFLAIGTSPADATAKVASATTSCRIPNMGFPITDWHIYSDSGPGKPNYIHVVCRHSNMVDSDIFNHFSFGELDKGGFSHSGVAYAASSGRRCYLDTASRGNTWNTQMEMTGGLFGHWSGYMSGTIGLGLTYSPMTSAVDSPNQTIMFLIDPTIPVVPSSGTWIQPGVLGKRTDLLDVANLTYQTASQVNFVNTFLSMSEYQIGMIASAHMYDSQIYSGGVTLMPIPMVLMNGAASSSMIIIPGSFPGIRACSMDKFSPKDEITYSTDTWQLMPMLRKTPWSDMRKQLISSGQIGYAYKKVL